MVDVSAEKATIRGIIGAGYPGFQGAYAIASTLFGDNAHLGGKLPYTVYPASYVNAITMSQMEMDVGPGRSYRCVASPATGRPARNPHPPPAPALPPSPATRRYYNGSVVWPFGWGLSYAPFAFTATSLSVGGSPVSSLNWPTGAPTANTATLSVTVTNTGSVAGDEVVFLFFAPQGMPQQAGSRLQRQLADFERVHLEAGASTTVQFTITTGTFVVVDKAGNTGDRVSTPGTFSLIATNGVGLTASWPVTLTGSQVVVTPFPGKQA
jgi:hypothetical protein